MNVNLVTGTGTGGDADGDQLLNIENISGSEFADTLTGSARANTLAGGDGADVLAGLDGDDVLIGGLGADQINGGDGFDVADYSFSSEAISINLAGNTAAGGDADGDVISNVEGLMGSGLADTLIGDAGDNVLFGGYGADTLTGGTGADDFMYDLLLLVNGEADTITDFEKGVDRLRMWGGDIDVDFTFIAGESPITTGSGPTYLYNTTTGLLSYSVLGGGLREIAYFPGLPSLDASDILVI